MARHDERGSTVIEVMLLMGLTLFMVVGFANLAVDGLIKGIAHSAADQGVRAGVRIDADSVRACEDRARQVMSNVLAGPAGSSVTLSCSDDGEVVLSRIEFTLPAWLPVYRDSKVTVVGEARKERLP